LVAVELNVGAPATLVTLGQLAREPSLQEAGLLVYLVDEPAQFGCLLAADSVVTAPLQALQLQRAVERLSPGTSHPLHLWSNSASLLQEASEMIRHTGRIAAPTSGAGDGHELHLVHLAAPGASWGLAVGRSPARQDAPAVVLVAPDDPRAVPATFTAEMRALVEQAGIPRQELVREVGAALMAKVPRE